ncbi:hypothetical protein BD324DRAFT_649220 [Kockovaella imperatae]|uniref:Uncharacterized protein n=1 Tax=Kockovaella imperatae TaxID=4999 RepID=A0A1Y1UM55_9TREE|nr:hypothetical protein BD324DRAFT_649220 [Kockovaella imperatae]ORX39131.1 hypothetical protein BD324DRAFT_649220 [Kockovaella imperatae]
MNRDHLQVHLNAKSTTYALEASLPSCESGTPRTERNALASTFAVKPHAARIVVEGAPPIPTRRCRPLPPVPSDTPRPTLGRMPVWHGLHMTPYDGSRESAKRDFGSSLMQVPQSSPVDISLKTRLEFDLGQLFQRLECENRSIDSTSSALQLDLGPRCGAPEEEPPVQAPDAALGSDLSSPLTNDNVLRFDTIDAINCDEVESPLCALDIFSPRLPPAPVLRSLTDPHPISPLALPSTLGVDRKGERSYFTVTSSQDPTSSEGDNKVVSKAPLSSLGAPGLTANQSTLTTGSSWDLSSTQSSFSMGLGASMTSCSSRFLSLKERDHEAQSHTTLSEIVSRTQSATSQDELSTRRDWDDFGFPVPSRSFDALFEPSFRVRAGEQTKPVRDLLDKGDKAEEPWHSGYTSSELAFDIDGLPHISLPETLLEDPPDPPKTYQLLPRASIATDTYIEVGAWWNAAGLRGQNRSERRKSAMDYDSLLEPR